MSHYEFKISWFSQEILNELIKHLIFYIIRLYPMPQPIFILYILQIQKYILLIPFHHSFCPLAEETRLVQGQTR